MASKKKKSVCSMRSVTDGDGPVGNSANRRMSVRSFYWIIVDDMVNDKMTFICKKFCIHNTA